MTSEGGDSGEGPKPMGYLEAAVPTLPYLEIPKRSLGASRGHRKLCLRLPGERRASREALAGFGGRQGDRAKGLLGPTNVW